MARTFDTLVRFVGYVDPIRRPVSFPSCVYEDALIRASNRPDFVQKLNDLAGMVAGRRGMFALKNPPENVQPPDVSFENRRFVPIEMITHIECIIKPITGETPITEDDGVSFVGDGYDRSEVKPS